jgi:hypothetical protein
LRVDELFACFADAPTVYGVEAELGGHDEIWDQEFFDNGLSVAEVAFAYQVGAADRDCFEQRVGQWLSRVRIFASMFALFH